MKTAKFFKMNHGKITKSKIARETDEAIKFLNKRQPLAEQNTSKIDDEILFSVKAGGRFRNDDRSTIRVSDKSLSRERNNSKSPSPR